MRLERLLPGASTYPRGLPPDPAEPPLILTCRGDSSLLRLPLTAIFCSSDTPADLVLPCLDLVLELREREAAVIGGFQSPLEIDCLEILLRGRQPVVVSPARSLESMRVRKPWEERLRAGSMLIVSLFGQDAPRPTVRHAIRRNQLIAGLADRVLVPHAGPGSRTIRTVAAAIEMGKRVYCFDHPRNRDLLLLGAWPLEPSATRRSWDEHLLTLASPAFH